MKLLALTTTHNGSAAIISTTPGGGGGEGEGEGGGDQIFSFNGHQVSEACTSSLRSSRCRSLYIEELSDGAMVLAIPLQYAVGLLQLKTNGTDLVEEAKIVLTIPSENCVPLDIVSYRDEGELLVFVICLRREMTLQVLEMCKILVNRDNISLSAMRETCRNPPKYYPAATKPSSYSDISNFAFFPEGRQFLFTIGSGLEGLYLDRPSVQSYRIYPNPSCDRLLYMGDHKLYMYCRSGEVLMYDIDNPTDPSSLNSSRGINFTCPFTFTLRQTADNGTMIRYNNIISNIGGGNLTFGRCYGERNFIIVDSVEGIKELDTNTGFVRRIANSSNFAQVLFLLEGPSIVGQRTDPSPEVVVYDENIEPVLRWPGSALAVGVVVVVSESVTSAPQPSSSSDAGLVVMPSTTTSSSLGGSSFYATPEPSLTSTSSSVVSPTLTSTLISQPQLTPLTPPTNSVSPSASSVPPTDSPSVLVIATTATVAAVAFLAMVVATLLTIVLCM